MKKLVLPPFSELLMGLISATLMLSVGILSAVLPSLGHAGTSATLTWTLATQNVDGSTLPSTNIKETYIEWRTHGTSLTVTPLGSLHVAAPATTVVANNLSCGTVDFVAYTVLVDTTQSAATTPLPYQTITCTPNPPGALTAH